MHYNKVVRTNNALICRVVCEVGTAAILRHPYTVGNNNIIDKMYERN